MIERTYHIHQVFDLFEEFPVVAILGARQVGKTTLAGQIQTLWKGKTHFYDLENPEDLARLSDPLLTLKSLKGLVILDEIQLMPSLFPILRVLSDRPHTPARFLILGSASPDLRRGAAESLAGRIAQIILTGFSLREVGVDTMERLWVRGSFPRSFLSRDDAKSMLWRKEFIKTFLERDLPQFGVMIPAPTIRRFWTMLAHVHGQVWNSSAFARSFGVADTTIRRYLDTLNATYTVYLLKPWHENVKKRQVRSPKVFIADSGILHALLDLTTLHDLLAHPKCGISWEGFAMTNIVQILNVSLDECFFWGTHSGAELDLLIFKDGKRYGFEFKRTSTPTVTRSMKIAIDDLHIERLFVIHAGEHAFPLSGKITAVPLTGLEEHLSSLSTRIY